MAEVILRTARLELRLPEMSDSPLVFRHLNGAAAMEHLGGPKTLEQIEERLARSVANFAAEGFCFLLIFEISTGELVGHCGLKRVDAQGARNPGDMEIGWLIREDRWRLGYAREAASAVLRHAFTDLAAPLVVALASDRNEASWRLMDRLGMERTQELDFDDPDFGPEDNPTIVYRLTRQQWDAAQ